MNDKIEIELAEDEDLARARAWWKENGSSIIGGIAIGTAMVVGYNYYQSYQADHAEQVATLYEVQTQAPDDEVALGALIDLDGKSTYAQLARMTSARKAMDAKQYDKAESLLNGVLTTSKDNGLKAVATLRLATVYLAQSKSDEVIKLLDAQASSNIPLQRATENELKGDAYFQKGDKEQSAKFYQASIDALTEAGQSAGLVQIKLDNL